MNTEKQDDSLVFRQTAFLLIALFLSVAAFSACRSEGVKPVENTAVREIADDLDKSVSLPNEVTRAVSLAPNLTEIIFAVGAGDRLVGVTSFCNFPEEATKIQKVGDTLKPNVENIIALKPQVVFVSTASQLESFTETLEKQGIEVFVTNPSSLDGIYGSIRKVGEVFGKTEQAFELVESLKRRVASTEEKTQNLGKISTFVQIDKSLYTIGKQSFLTDLIARAGGISATRDVETAYPKISKEKALALNPEAIILSDSADNDEPNEVFRNSRAVKDKKVFKISADILSRPGPRVVDALEQIAKSLHPEKFD